MKITKCQITLVLNYLDSVNALDDDTVCDICKYEDTCEEHGRCVKGITEFIFEEVNK